MRRRPPALEPPRPVRAPLPAVAQSSAGLRVLVLERRDLPLVHLQLVVLGGTSDDPEGRPGVAYVTAAMLDEGAGERSALRIASDLQNVGTALETTVDRDTTTLALDLLRDDLELGLEVLGDVVQRPRMEQRELRRAKRELEQRALNERSDPDAAADQALRIAIHGAHPLGRSLMPRPEQLQALRRSDVTSFHRAHYRAPNALLCVAGDVSVEEVLALARRRLGRWRGAAPPRPRHAQPPRRTPRLIIVDRPESAESVVRVGHVGPSRRLRATAALDVLNTVLGGSFTSRLNRNLRETHGFTYGVDSTFSSWRTRGTFAVRTAVDAGATRAALQEVLRELRRIVHQPVGARELAKAVNLVVEDLTAQVETLGQLADAYADLAVYGQSLRALNRRYAEAAALTAADLHRAARAHLRPERATIVVVGDAASLRPELERDFGPAIVHDGASAIL